MLTILNVRSSGRRGEQTLVTSVTALAAGVVAVVVTVGDALLPRADPGRVIGALGLRHPFLALALWQRQGVRVPGSSAP